MTEEDFKGAVHAVAGTLFAVMAAYNVMRWCATKHRRNAINVLIYLPLAPYEGYQVWRHWSRMGNAEPH